MNKKNNLLGLTTITLVLLTLVLALQACASRIPANEPVSLTLFHNNDGEGSLLPEDGYAGASAFVALLQQLRSNAESEGRATLMLSSGDNFLAGVAFSASQKTGVYYDAIALNHIGYDAIALGNHDFDFGPDVLADFMKQMDPQVPYLSANIDVSQEPGLAAMKRAGRLSSSVIVESQGQAFGIVSAVTPELGVVSSPRKVAVGQDVLAVVQKEVDALTSKGVNKIILISHLQGIDAEIDLVKQLRGVDIVVAGGGDEILTSQGYPLIPKDAGKEVYGTYPLIQTDAEDNPVPIVTTPGEYKYIGKLEVSFDAEGHLIGDTAGGLVRVATPESGEADAVAAIDAEVEAMAVAPVREYKDSLGLLNVAETEVKLDGTRQLVRTRETNFGNLVADAILWQARKLAGEYNAPTPVVAIQNGGSIRKSVVIEAGQTISQLNLFTALPFSNFLTIVPDISAEQFKLLLENAISQVEGAKGRFAQISGFSVTYDLDAQPLILDNETYEVMQEGQRVVEVKLDDGSYIVRDGKVVSGAPSVVVAAPDYIVRGGDQYPFYDAPFTILSVEYRQAVENYMSAATEDGGLGGKVLQSQYPAGKATRIFTK